MRPATTTLPLAAKEYSVLDEQYRTAPANSSAGTVASVLDLARAFQTEKNTLRDVHSFITLTEQGSADSGTGQSRTRGSAGGDRHRSTFQFAALSFRPRLLFFVPEPCFYSCHMVAVRKELRKKNPEGSRAGCFLMVFSRSGSDTATTPVCDLNKKLKYWDYQEVLQIHEALQMVNESINSLGLVPQGF